MKAADTLTEAYVMWRDRVLSPVDNDWRPELKVNLETEWTDPDTSRRYCGNQQHSRTSGLTKKLQHLHIHTAT